MEYGLICLQNLWEHLAPTGTGGLDTESHENPNISGRWRPQELAEGWKNIQIQSRAKPVAKVAKGPTKIETESEAKVAEY